MERFNLRDLRGNKPLREVAAVLGITPQMLGKVELKRRRPSLSLAQKIANYYGVTVEAIFFNDLGDKMCQKDRQEARTGVNPAAKLAKTG